MGGTDVVTGTVGTVDGFSYGVITPLAAYLMACLGGALGLRCTTRSLLVERSWRPGWLALGATAIGSGIWTMHFIAMMGFSVAESPLNYDKRTTFASLAVAIVMVGVGIFIVGYRGSTPMSLVTGGTITGLGVASMHYLGMAGMRLRGHLEYDTKVVALSVVIAVVAATAALWAAVSVRGFLPAVGASLVMGGAVSGMHYTAMTSVSVRLHGGFTDIGGSAPATLLAPMLIGPVVFLVVAGVVVMFDPLLVMGTPDWKKPGETPPPAPRPRRPVHPVPPRADQGYGQAYDRAYDHVQGQVRGSGYGRLPGRNGGQGPDPAWDRPYRPGDR
ncbi:MHYT domain-containing protein [Streptomyces sp. NPDC101132]|uniref:MHYT domain-containing protein n=1 Tax=Streptomyces sp. NPDC101132 TaxID=3366110 RepID=UPI00381A7733